MKNLVGISKDKILILLLCAFAVLCWVPRLKGPIDLRWDGGAYYILGTSIAEGKGYRLLNEPGEINSTLHPPLLPALVAIHQLLLGTSDPVIVGRWLRLSFFLAFIIYVIAAYLTFRFFLTSNYAFVAALVCLLHFNTLFLSDLLYAELLFALTTILFFVCYKKSDKKAYSLLSIPFVLASYGLRTLGVALFAAWIGESLLKKEFKKAIFRLTISLIPILCWQSYIYSVESDSQYQNSAYEYQHANYMYPNVSYVRNTLLIDSFAPEKGYITPAGRIRRFAGNVIMMPAALGESITTNEGYWNMSLSQFSSSLRLPLPDKIKSWLVFIALLIFGFMIIVGGILQLIKREWFVPLYVSAYLAMMCLTPWPGQFGRYLMPLIPFLVLSLLETLLFIKVNSYKILSGKWIITGHVFTTLVLFLILQQEVFTGYITYRNYLVPVAYNDNRGQRVELRQFYFLKSHRNLDEGINWLMLQGEPGKIVAGSWPHWIYLRTGLKAVLPPFEADPETAQRLLDTVPVKYLLLEKDDFLGMKKYVSPVVQNGWDQWKLVFSTQDGDFEIYERISK